MTSPFMKRMNPTDKGSHGRRAESLVAKRLGGIQQPASGALDGAKGDYVVPYGHSSFLFENKATSGASIGVQREWLHKVYQEALETNREPALSLQFTNSSGLSEKRDRWVAVPEHVFLALISA